MKRQLHLNLFIQSRGHHEASWRHPKASAQSLNDIEFYVDCAKRAEEGLFDSVFLADSLSIGEDVGRAARTWLEPVTLLGALAMATQRIGLIATASTTYTEPFNLTRQFASLDHISKGRIGWNIVTSWSVPAAANYGDDAQVSHADRYARAEEFVTLAKALWDSWGDNAIVDDRDGGDTRATKKFGRLSMLGALFGSRPAQRSTTAPRMASSGTSGFIETGRAFAARHAEAIFTAHLEKSTASEFYADLKARVRELGRDPAHAVVLPGLSPCLAATETEAQRYAQELNELADPEVGRRRLSGRFGGYDFSHLPLDEPLSPDDFPDPSDVQAARSRAEVIVGIVKRERLTLRALLARLAGARGHFTFAGTPEQLADLMQSWLNDGAADGFNLMPPVLPHMLDVFVDEVVPILQQRGLFRREYSGKTLREHFALPRPVRTL